MDRVEGLQGTTATAMIGSIGVPENFDADDMTFFNTTRDDSVGVARWFDCHFDAGWSAPDYDGDTGASNCAQTYSNVTQHYCACWNMNLGSDANDPNYDGGVGPHVSADNATDLGLASDGSSYTRVRRITRYVRW